jgi:hypothetical protein
VLVLNSDVEADDDFVTPLVAALLRDAGPAAAMPVLDGVDLDPGRYRRRAGLVESFTLFGYAFLVRRAGFEAAGGFDPAFGRGYFEDTDLGRRLIARGGWLGLCPEARLRHAGGASFAAVPGVPALAARNRALYRERHPGARRRVVLLTREERFSRLPSRLRRDVEALLAAGGRVDWLCPGGGRELPGVPMRTRAGGVGRTSRALLRRHGGRPWRRPTELWTLDDAPAAARALLAALARARGTALAGYAGEEG